MYGHWGEKVDGMRKFKYSWIGVKKMIIKVSRYRHYGVYLTGEKDSSGGLEEILDNPVYALDR